MSEVSEIHEGLILDDEKIIIPTAAPETREANISWLPHCLPGDDQGMSGACAVFSVVNWAEIMYGVNISDDATLKIYSKALERAGKKWGKGLSFPDAFAACKEHGLIKNHNIIERTIDLNYLVDGPILAGYKYTMAFTGVSTQGCLDHKANDGFSSYHAVAIVAKGVIPPAEDEWIWIENSHGTDWGWRGIGMMRRDLHDRLIGEMWRIV